MRALLLIAPFLILTIFASVRAGAGSSEIAFTKLLDSDALAPGGLGAFGSFEIGEDRPRLAMDDHGNLAFFARSRAFAIIDGEIHLVSEPRGGPAQIEIEDGRVTFAHYGDSGSNGGIFRWQPGSDPIAIAGPRTFVPDGGACVFWTQEEAGVAGAPFRVDGDAVLFFGTSNDRAYDDGQHFDCDDLHGSFLWRNGSIERVGYRGFGASIDAGLLVFMGPDGGLYARRAGEASQRIVWIGDPLPGGSGAFRTIGSFAVAAGRIGFRGSDGTDPTRSSVFLWESGVLSFVAEEGMPLPGGRKLERIGSLWLGDDRIAIFGSDGQGWLLYLASLGRGWERVVDLSGPDHQALNVDKFDFDRNQLVLEGLRIVGGDGSTVRSERVISVIRTDGSLLEVLAEGDVLEGHPVGIPFAGDLRGNKLALGVSDESGQHLYVAELPPIEVGIDIKPRRARNRVGAASHQPIRVAILGAETFYVEDVDVATLGFGPGAAQPVGKARLRDVNGDGWHDLVLRFRPRETGIVAGETEVCLSGETLNAVAFEGCDSVRTSRATAPRSLLRKDD